MRTPLVPSKVSLVNSRRGVPNPEASGIFPVGVAMRTRALSAPEVRSRALPCCTLAGKAS